MTGIVIKKMIKSTNMTSTRGVVLMVEFNSSSPPLDPTLIAMNLNLVWSRFGSRPILQPDGFPQRYLDEPSYFLAAAGAAA
jgi:hypothetical protein